MPTLADLLVQKPANAPELSAIVVQFTSATATKPDVDFVNATNRTPASGQNGVLLRVNGTFYLVGLF